MSRFGTTSHDPASIGEFANPPFVRLADPMTLFALRALRFRSLAEGHQLAAYLRFLACLSEAQHYVQADLPEPRLPGPEARERARDFAMPPLDRSRFVIDHAFEVTFEHLFGLIASAEMPQSAGAALDRASKADQVGRNSMVRAILADSVPTEALAEHVFIAAALQVHFARAAATLAAGRLVPVGEGVCPACGAPPVVSLLAGWQGAHGTRFCCCAQCATLWNTVRIKCVICGSTKGIVYREVEGGPGVVKAETCDECRTYVKILNQQKDPDVDPVADDVASLGLDLLMRKHDFHRGSVNPFLTGY